MRIHRVGKRIYVHGVPLDTSWFCPYCCATVDTPLLSQFYAVSCKGTSQNVTLCALR
jgi:hypothetical protein